MAPQIAAVVNLHRERTAAVPSLISALRAVQEAERAGHAVEMLIVLDRADDATKAVADDWQGRGARLVTCDEGDLGAQPRNAAIAATSAEYVAFLDSDDLWGVEWLTRAIAAAETFDESDGIHVFHPEVNVIFGDHHSLMIHRPSTDPTFRRARLRLHNGWTALSFGRRETFAQWPYPRNRLDDGFGFEDWSWNLAILDAGGTHHVVPDTCHFVRRTNTGSLLGASRNALRTPYPNSNTDDVAQGEPPAPISLTPTDADLPATHRRVPHELSAAVLNQIGLATTIEPAIEKTISRTGHPRRLPINHNDHVTVEQQALEAVERLRATSMPLETALHESGVLGDLARPARARVVAELLLAELHHGNHDFSVADGPIAEALGHYPQLRPEHTR